MKEYENVLRYSFGFEGYINNMIGVHNNIELGHIRNANFDNSMNCVLENQYYPPLLEETPVKNNCTLDKNIIVTGVNASGKTTFLKTTTINIIITQQVGCGFYDSCTLNPYTHIHSYLNIPDTSGRDSLFQAESRRCKEIIDSIHKFNTNTHRHYCIFDELYSGTNPEEATKSAYAFLLYLSKFNNVNYILTTHYVSLCEKCKKTKLADNYKMVTNVNDNTLTYTYQIKKGISKDQGALKILEQMDYPEEIIENIRNYDNNAKHVTKIK